MPSANLGGFQFRYIEGADGEVVPLAKLKSTPFTRPGYAGYGYHFDAVRGESVTITGMAPFATATLRSVAMIQAAALEGATLHNLYTNDGELWYYMKVNNVKCKERNVAADTQGLNFHLYVTMDLQSAAVGY
jgi:hypothetical protein